MPFYAGSRGVPRILYNHWTHSITPYRFYVVPAFLQVTSIVLTVNFSTICSGMGLQFGQHHPHNSLSCVWRPLHRRHWNQHSRGASTSISIIINDASVKSVSWTTTAIGAHIFFHTLPTLVWLDSLRKHRRDAHDFLCGILGSKDAGLPWNEWSQCLLNKFPLLTTWRNVAERTYSTAGAL